MKQQETHPSFNTQEVFNMYTENKNLQQADIFHLYDTGEECIKENKGYHDSRMFNLIAFNTQTMEKRNCGFHDGLQSFNDNVNIYLVRIYADGSTMIRLHRPATISVFQCIELS